MATASNFTITLKNSTGGEVKAKKFQYKDEGKWKVENIFGLDGNDVIKKGGSNNYKRDLGGIGGETTQFSLIYNYRENGACPWGGDLCETTDYFKACDGESKIVTLTMK